MLTTLSRSQLNDPTRPVPITHQFSLLAVAFRDAGWTADEIEPRLRRVARIIGQCGVAISSATLVLVDAPNGWIDVDGQTAGPNANYERIAEMLPMRERPVIFYVRASRGGQTGFANPLLFYGAKPSYALNTAWITRDVATPAYIKIHDPSYSPDAHELAHVLGNQGHIDDEFVKNLLSDFVDSANDQLTPAQCARIKTQPMVIPR